jgi:hypothetical protein
LSSGPRASSALRFKSAPDARGPEEHDRREFLHFRLFVAETAGSDLMPVFQGFLQISAFLHFPLAPVRYAI